MGLNKLGRQKYTAERLGSEPSALEFELAIEKLKSHRSPDIDQTTAKLIKVGCRKISYEIHELIISICNKEELTEEWNESIIVPTYKRGDKTNCSNYRGMSISQLRTKFYPTSCCQS